MSGEPVATGTEREVCRDIAARQRLGIAKYGRTVAENPLSMREWLQHAYEEVLDTAVYLKRLMEEMDGPGRVCGGCGGVVAGRHGTCRQCLEEDVCVSGS